MTAQEIFDEVWRAMAAQGRPSKRGTTCLYRGPKGTKCAVGCLLTDAEAKGLDDSMDGSSVGSVYRQGRLPERLVPHLQLLAYLQEAHDRQIDEGATWLDQFQESARAIAAQLHLTVPA